MSDEEGTLRPYGSQSMVETLRRVVVRAPGSAFENAEPGKWHYAGRPDGPEARREHAALVDMLRASGVEVLFHDEELPQLADAIFVHDPALVCDEGTILLRMGKQLRRGEEDALGRALERFGVPLRGRLQEAATAEGGDLLWLDHGTLAVGQGFRTNAEGLRQLQGLLGAGVECVAVPLPWHGGAEACLHLMSLVSMIDHDLAVAYEPLLPVPFVQLLRGRGIEIVPVPEEELATQGPNVLAIAPRRCVMLENNPVTRARLQDAGCEVLTYRGNEISLKAEGGATCLTRPVWRSCA